MEKFAPKVQIPQLPLHQALSKTKLISSTNSLAPLVTLAPVLLLAKLKQLLVHMPTRAKMDPH